jgi:hypothetical protein
MSDEVLLLRVTVQDAWDAVPLEMPSSASVAELKLRALTMAHVAEDPRGYEVKYRGASLRNETASLADARVVDNAALIVLAVRRRAVQ